jgi:hypothetical protein
VLTAKLSKIVQRTTFSLWSEFPNLPFVRLVVKQKVGFLGGRTALLSPGFGKLGWRRALLLRVAGRKSGVSEAN